MRQISRNVFVLCLLTLILPGGRAAAQPPPTAPPDAQVSVAPPVSAVPAGEPELTEANGGAEPWSLGDWASDIWYGIVQAWNIQLASVDAQPITVGKIITGILVLLVGFLAARILSRGVGNRLLSRFGLNENAAGVVQSLSFYLLLVIFAWMALQFANKAVYRKPEDAWGLTVWKHEPPEEVIARSLRQYDAFYDTMRELLAEVEQQYGRFFV